MAVFVTSCLDALDAAGEIVGGVLSVVINGFLQLAINIVGALACAVSGGVIFDGEFGVIGFLLVAVPEFVVVGVGLGVTGVVVMFGG